MKMDKQFLLRLKADDYLLMKANAKLRGLSMNQYLTELIRIDGLYSRGVSDSGEVTNIVKETNDTCKELLTFSYVTFKLGAAILSYSYHHQPTEEGIQNTRNFINRKLEEANEQFKK